MLNYRNLWGAVLDEAICTWALLHPDWAERRSNLAFDAWADADWWLFGKCTDTLELALAATGRTRGSVLRSANWLLGKLPRGTVLARRRALKEMAQGQFRGVRAAVTNAARGYVQTVRAPAKGMRGWGEVECARCGKLRPHKARQMCEYCYNYTRERERENFKERRAWRLAYMKEWRERKRASRKEEPGD